MKKIIKRVFLVMCIATIFVLPVTASAYSPSWMYEDASMNYKYFEFNQPIIINPGHCESLLNNTNNGVWYMHDKASAWLGVNFVELGNYRILVIKEDGSPKAVYDEVINTVGFFSFGLNNLEEGNYRFVVYPADSKPAAICAYYVDID